MAAIKALGNCDSRQKDYVQPFDLTKKPSPVSSVTLSLTPKPDFVLRRYQLLVQVPANTAFIPSRLHTHPGDSSDSQHSEDKMQPFNKLAGVEEASNIQNHPPPPPIPDLESQPQQPSLHSRPSRASLPVNRKPSRRTLHEQSSRNSLRPPSLHPSLLPPSPGWQGIPNVDYTASAHSHDTQLEDELPWGPSHPCFPHLNPHVAISSPAYATTRVIRIQRDWLVAGDLYPALQNLYPEILDLWMSESEFRTVIETLNPMLKHAFEPNTWASWFDALMGVATGFLWDNFGWTGVKRGVRDMEKWVEGWNTEAEREGREVRLIDLRRTGFLSLDIQIPDPHVDVGDGDVMSI